MIMKIYGKFYHMSREIDNDGVGLAGKRHRQVHRNVVMASRTQMHIIMCDHLEEYYS